LELNGGYGATGDYHHRRPSDLVLACFAMARFLTTVLLGLVLVSTFTVGVSTLTGFKLSSLILHSDRDVLRMTPTDF
jgi:hypothetical protein